MYVFGFKCQYIYHDEVFLAYVCVHCLAVYKQPIKHFIRNTIILRNKPYYLIVQRTIPLKREYESVF